MTRKRIKTYNQIFTKNYLLDAYLNRGLSLREIAAEVRKDHPTKKQCAHTTVSLYMRRRKIALRSVRNLYSTLDLPSVIRAIPKIVLREQKIITLDCDPDPENINILITDFHIGQKFYNETEGEAMNYFIKAFAAVEENIDKIISHLKYDWQCINLFLAGDLLEGEGIYPNQAYESFQLMRQLEIAKVGFRNLIMGLRERYNLPINIICVRGNHGQTRHFSSEEANWDTVLYLLLEEGLGRFDDITFHRTDYWAIDFTDQFKNRYLVTHGDALKGGSPTAGVRDAILGWNMSFNDFDIILMGHFHNCTIHHLSGVEMFVNGCFRYNDFPVFKNKTEPDRHIWMFGSGKGRAATWRYKVEVEPKGMKDQIRQNIDTRSYSELTEQK